MGVREFSIKLDSNRQVFYPGESITGNVILDIQGQMNMKGITIEFEGTFRVRLNKILSWFLKSSTDFVCFSHINAIIEIIKYLEIKKSISEKS